MTLKEKIIDMIYNSQEKINIDKILFLLDLGSRDRKIIKDVLKDIEKEGLVYMDKDQYYHKVDSPDIYEGILDMAEKGFGFVIVEGRDDIFIPRDNLNTAMDGDTVLVKINENKKASSRSEEGQIEKIVKRKIENLVGTIQVGDSFGFVVPDNKSIKQDIYINKQNLKNARNGQKVLVKIIKYPSAEKKPEGKVEEILGFPGDAGIDVLSVAMEKGIKLDFPKKVKKQANEVPQTIEGEDISKRLDLRDELIFTIDGIDAKDLDDAVSLEILDNGNYYLGVHIADVAHYVKEGTPIDREAKKRGNSIYLIDRVVPMLPQVLSNGICSLNPDVDRLCLSVFMEIDKKGRLKASEIKESVINSKKRLNYTDVSNYLENDDKEAEKALGPAAPVLKEMENLQKILSKKRDERGALDFDFEDAKILVDDEGRVTDIVIDERRIGNKIIEEFMIIANETVSETYYWMDLPFLYRIHEMPDEEKIGIFLKFIRTLGYSVKGSQNEIHPRELQEILDEADGTEEDAVINRMMLRSLKKARYSEINDIHFGLSSKYYSHFTAPIRRYPDLQIHRIIKESLQGKLSPKRISHYESILHDVALHTSKTEREAEEAERDVEKLKKAEYMAKFVGERFHGIISGVTSFGIFVELPNTVEGLVHYNNMSDDFYVYNDSNMTAMGERGHKEYKLGQKVEIEVYHVDPSVGVVDFLLVNEE